MNNEIKECENCTLDYVCNAENKYYKCQKIKEMDTEIQNQGITIADLELCRDMGLECKQQLLAEQAKNKLIEKSFIQFQEELAKKLGIDTRTRICVPSDFYLCVLPSTINNFVDNLQAKNKKLVEALEGIAKYNYCHEYSQLTRIAQQALNEVNNDSTM